MKLIILIASVCIMQVSASINTHCQNLSFKVNGEPLKEVLKTIESRSNYRFFYNEGFSDLNKNISCEINNMSIAAILDKLLEGSRVYYKIMDNNLIVIAPVAELQQVTVSGIIIDAKTNEPLPGVNILVKGTTQGVISDIDGKFSVQVPNASATLVFSFVGYNAEEVAVQGKTQLNISLIPDIKALDEVIVIGYGTQKKGDVTSSIASVKSEDFTKGFIRDASDLVKGKVAGLNISNGSGDPSVEASIMLRGVASLYGGTTPLILINGVAGGLNTVAPEDIESVDVLKDASAAAIYGTRGANGVILITTKSGKRNMKPEVSYNSYLAVSNFAKKADFLDASDIRRLLAAGTTLPFTDEGATTDWLKEITRTGITQNHSVSLKGGQENFNYAANITYIDKNGVFDRTDNNQLKATFDVNQYFLKDLIKINLNFIKGLDKSNAVGAASSFNSNIYRQALIRNPTAPIKDSDGNWVETSRFQYYNPVAMIKETAGILQDEYTRLTSNVTVHPFDGFEVNAMLSTRTSNGMTGYSESKKHYSTTLNGLNGVASKYASNTTTNDMELTSRYNKTLGMHRFSAMGGYSYEYHVFEDMYAYNYNFPSDNYSYNNLYAGYALKNGKAVMTSSKSDDKLIAFFGRVSYGFGDRYNIMASIRREGSSKFGKNNKWGDFPSVSLGWTISNESFMKSISVIDNLKLRAGYGITGVIPTDSYKSQTLYSYSSDAYFYNDGTWVKGLVPASNPNPDLRWEKSGELNIGLDFAVLKNRISGSVDVYHKKTTNMLWEYSVPVPPYLYSTILANVGAMTNEGIEVALSGIPIQSKDFEWKSNLTLSHNKNKLLSLSNDMYAIDGNYINTGDCGDPISFPTHRLEVGQSLGNFWGLKSVDISDKGVWIIETPSGTKEELSSTMYNDNYKQYLGNGIPKVNMGWTNNFRYKNFDLSFVFNGAFGFKILNYQRMFYENPNINYNMLKSAFDKVYGKTVLNYSQTYVSYYIENGNYVKLDNVTLGYSVNVNKIKFVKAMRFYASAQNVACITGYKGLDPEIVNPDMKYAGDDFRDKYPSIRTFTFGLNLTF